jgi:hypothetical protein
MLIKSFLVIFIVFQSYSSSSSVVDYHNCVNKRALSVLKSQHREALICELGDSCILKSVSCHHLNPTNAPKSVWKRKEAIGNNFSTIFFDIDRYLIDPTTGDLTISQTKSIDQGYFVELLYNQTTSIREYHLTILSERKRYPLYEMDENNELQKNASSSFLGATLWGEWSTTNCECTGMNYRIRFGDCYLNKSIDLSLDGLFELYNNWIPCYSALLGQKYRLIIFFYCCDWFLFY